MDLYNVKISKHKYSKEDKHMKKISSLVLKSIGSLAVCILFLSANTTSNWLSHQPSIPKDLNRFKKHSDN